MKLLLDEGSVVNYIHQEIQDHAESLVAGLRAEYERHAALLRADAAISSEGSALVRCEISVHAQTPAGQVEPSPYNGCDWSFDLTNETSIPIGRSKAKKFLQSGISMPKDNGVSTSHAKVI